MKNILDVFDFKEAELKDKELNVLLSMLSNDEKKVFNLLKFSNDALTATQIYDNYIDNIIDDDPYLKKEIKTLKKQLDLKRAKRKKPLEIKAEFIRGKNIKVPTNRTITRVLDNLKDAGFILKRNTNNKKAKAYYCLMPRLKLILEEKDPDLRRKREIDQVMKRVKKIKHIIKEKK